MNSRSPARSRSLDQHVVPASVRDGGRAPRSMVLSLLGRLAPLARQHTAPSLSPPPRRSRGGDPLTPRHLVTPRTPAPVTTHGADTSFLRNREGPHQIHPRREKAISFWTNA